MSAWKELRERTQREMALAGNHWDAIGKHLDAYEAAYAHELAERQRRLTRKVCVNDRDGDGDCAACARNPEAPCRQYSREDKAIRMAADEIDPEVSTCP